MSLGPMLDRELLRLARQWTSYGRRMGLPLLMLTAICLNGLAWRHVNDGPATVQQVALFGRLLFAQFLFIQGMMTLYLVPAYLARSIAEEKDRGTLTFLLTTHLSSGSIILGKLGAGLWQYASCLLAGLPVVLLLPLFGGIEPELVIVSYVGLVTTALFVAGVSVVNSVVCRQGRDAHRTTVTVIAAWLFGPLILALTIPKLSMTLYVAIRPINHWLLVSSPTGLLVSFAGPRTQRAFLEGLGQMIAIQAACALVLVLVAIAQLRPAWRRHHEGRASRPGRGDRARSKPGCGERPMLWKELRVVGRRGGARLVSRLAFLLAVLALGVITSYSRVAGAAVEVFSFGYGNSTHSTNRVAFNQYLRAMTVVISFLYTLGVTGLASQGITVERSQGTWLGLIATPIETRQILRAKMLGAFWPLRYVAFLLVGFWGIGLVVGAVHPLGFLACMIGLAVSTWCLTALGTYASLRGKDSATASNLALSPVLALSLSGFLPMALPAPLKSVVLGAFSIPFLESVMLGSYDEVNQGILAFPSPTLTATGILSREGGRSLLLACALGFVGAVLTATVLARLAERQFDRLVGRPWRRPVAESRPAPGSGGGRPRPAIESMNA